MLSENNPLHVFFPLFLFFLLLKAKQNNAIAATCGKIATLFVQQPVFFNGKIILYSTFFAIMDSI
jgi:hypothetical protein